MDGPEVSYSLGMNFAVEANTEEEVSVDLEGVWSEDTAVVRFPGFVDPRIVFVYGEVGKGGDHMNMCFKNISDGPVTIKGDTIVAMLQQKEHLNCDSQVSPTTDSSSKNLQQSETSSKGSNQAKSSGVTEVVETSNCESNILGTVIPGCNKFSFSHSLFQFQLTMM